MLGRIGIVICFIFCLVGSIDGKVWDTSHADVDGDGVDEGIDYVIGENGEPNVPYVYQPISHFHAWNTVRTCMGTTRLRQVLTKGGQVLLDTGEPTFINWVFYYVDTYYESMRISTVGDKVVIRWESPGAVLERIVYLTDDFGLNRFRMWLKGQDGAETFLGETALLIVWNDGMTTIEQAKAYVQGQVAKYKAVYSDSIPGLVRPGDYTLKIKYVFDDYVLRSDDYWVIGWDGGYYTGPSTTAIWGMLHLPRPSDLSCEYLPPPSVERTIALWHAPAGLPADLKIEPEVINLKSRGRFTGTVTLPTGHEPSEISLSTVQCEGAKLVKCMFTATSLIAKFNIQDLVGVLPGEAVPFRLTGQLQDGTPFAGVDTVCVILPDDRDGCPVNSQVLKRGDQVPLGTPSAAVSGIPVTARIYNQAGRLVKTVVVPRGSAEPRWDMKDDNGLVVVPGVYFIRTESVERQATRKIVVLP